MYKKYVKRLLDLILCSIALVICGPIIICVGILIKLFDGESVMFVQKRVGINGKIFNIYKFRTMTIQENDKNGKTLTHNKRITKIGKFLRITSIDELPQLFNILKGDMSFIRT